MAHTLLPQWKQARGLPASSTPPPFVATFLDAGNMQRVMDAAVSRAVRHVEPGLKPTPKQWEPWHVARAIQLADKHRGFDASKTLLMQQWAVFYNEVAEGMADRLLEAVMIRGDRSDDLRRLDFQPHEGLHSLKGRLLRPMHKGLTPFLKAHSSGAFSVQTWLDWQKAASEGRSADIDYGEWEFNAM